MIQRRSARLHARSVFVDSSAFYALASSRDHNHATALTIARRLDAERWRRFTSTFVRAEAHALVLNRAGHRAADAFLVRLRTADEITVVRVEEADEAQALDLVLRYRDKDFTLTDAISFVLMDRLDIQYGFTFDQDFRQYGVTVL